MKIVKLRTSGEALHWRRTTFAITRIEIGLPLLKDETSFMSNLRRIDSRSGSARVLPDGHLEVETGRIAGWQRKGGGPKFGLDRETLDWNKTVAPAGAGEKTSGF